MESPWRLGLAVRLTGLVAVGLVLALPLAGRAGAVIPGRNGLLLIGAPQGTRFSAAGAPAPQARVADCYPGAPDALWTVRPNGSHLKSVGPGSGGQFSPGGRSLLISDYQPCSSAASLSLSFAPFRAERPIPGAAGGGDGNASPGSWLGPERPSVFDDAGRYLDALTGRLLLPDAGHSLAGGGAPGQASCDGRLAVYGSSTPSSLSIVTPLRSGRRVVAARRLIVALRSPGDYIDAQWSPDGRYLFYVLYHTRANSSSLWRVDSDGAGRRRLYTDRVNSDLLATVSPDGRWVLLQVLAGANGELWVIGSDGHGLHPLATTPAGADLSATGEWSPRGDRIFVTQEPSPSQLVPVPRVAFVIRPGGRGRHAVPYPALANSPVVWSPDERDLAFDVGGSSLVIAPVAGGPTRTVLTAAAPSGLSASDWQAVPGTGRPFKCLDGRPPF